MGTVRLVRKVRHVQHGIRSLSLTFHCSISNACMCEALLVTLTVLLTPLLLTPFVIRKLGSPDMWPLQPA